jgi:hypothetical protein
MLRCCGAGSKLVMGVIGILPWGSGAYEERRILSTAARNYLGKVNASVHLGYKTAIVSCLVGLATLKRGVSKTLARVARNSPSQRTRIIGSV